MEEEKGQTAEIKSEDANQALKNAGGDFTLFVTSLSMQTLISLGEVPNPANGKKEQNLDQAKYMVDTIGMIKEKTKGNLSKSEESIIENVLYQLRMKYLEMTKDQTKE